MARILIVEDEESNRLLLTEALEYGGHQVTPAVDGIEALEKISCPPPGPCHHGYSHAEEGWR